MLLGFSSFNAEAFSILTRKEGSNVQLLRITSYSDYFPFGAAIGNSRDFLALDSLFSDVFEQYILPKDYRLEFVAFENLEETLSALHDNKAEVFVGAYYASNDFEKLDFVFPAVLVNPVHLMMTPDKISMVKKLDDLKNLKGIYNSKEHFADYTIQKLKEMNVEPVESADEAYKKILTGEADYLLGSYYYNYAKTAEMGLKDYVSFSTGALWNMPMFIAISKGAKNAKNVHELFRRLASDDVFRESVVENLKKTVKEREEASQGVVPPMYVRAGGENDLTPADEVMKGEE